MINNRTGKYCSRFIASSRSQYKPWIVPSGSCHSLQTHAISVGQLSINQTLKPIVTHLFYPHTPQHLAHYPSEVPVFQQEIIYQPTLCIFGSSYKFISHINGSIAISTPFFAFDQIECCSDTTITTQSLLVQKPTSHLRSTLMAFVSTTKPSRFIRSAPALMNIIKRAHDRI